MSSKSDTACSFYTAVFCTTLNRTASGRVTSPKATQNELLAVTPVTDSLPKFLQVEISNAFGSPGCNRSQAYSLISDSGGDLEKHAE
ncbi:hypothetical protein B0H34DRAFT_700992 [Crassisporium funariophilum]|nr:hypothetical protein B0H34DRAFT_700992 [Crassisporium funariophilum]